MAEKIYKFLNLNPPKKTTTVKKENINNFIENITNLLQVKCCHIEPVACIFEYGGQTYVQKELREKELPKDALFTGGYYLYDESNSTIYLPHKCAHYNPHTLSRYFVDISAAENLFSIAHELRHVWQLKYPDIYYVHNAVSVEAINDIAEIDADAFAIAFVLSDQTPYTYKDMPNTLDDIFLQATADEGKRLKRAYELALEYGFNIDEKIIDARANVDMEQINNQVMFLKLNKLL